MIMRANGSTGGSKPPRQQLWRPAGEGWSPGTPEGFPGSLRSAGWTLVNPPGPLNDPISETKQTTTADTTQIFSRSVEYLSRVIAHRENATDYSVALRKEGAYQYGRDARTGKGPSERRERPEAASLPRGRLTGPVRFVQRLLQDWHLDERAACLILGFEEGEASYVEDLLAGRVSLRGRDVKHRIAFLLQIRETLDGLFRDLSVENEWIRERAELLDNRSPIDVLLEGSFISLLKVKEFVDVVAGR